MIYRKIHTHTHIYIYIYKTHTHIYIYIHNFHPHTVLKVQEEHIVGSVVNWKLGIGRHIFQVIDNHIQINDIL